MKKYYFISGLPRSGSTLLSSIFKQNPRFHAGVSSQLLQHFRSLFESCNEVQQSERCPKRTERMLRSLVDSYFQDIDREVIFDTNRLWTNLLPQLNMLYPYTRIIICVRDITRIIDSFERMHQRNALQISTVFPKTVDMHVYSRSEALMAPGGIISLPYDSLKSAMCGMYRGMLFFCEYDMLTKDPQGMMRAIYNFIDQPFYQHDFDNVENSFDEYDNDLNLPGLHTVRKKVSYEQKEFLIPPDVIEKFSNLEVWR